MHLAGRLHISPGKVYSVATFYDRFSLEAKGKYILRVCDGTACHVRKSQPILEALQEHLGLNEKKGDEQRYALHAGDRCVPRRVRPCAGPHRER